MIRKDVFYREFGLLFERFGRNAEAVSDVLVNRYLSYLNEHLSTEDFEVAAQQVFNEDQFFPSPRRFVDIIHGNAKQNAERAWQDVLQLAQAGESDLSGLPAATRDAVKAAGGWRAIAYAGNDFGLGQARRAFLDAYAARLAKPVQAAAIDNSDPSGSLAVEVLP